MWSIMFRFHHVQIVIYKWLFIDGKRIVFLKMCLHEFSSYLSNLPADLRFVPAVLIVSRDSLALDRFFGKLSSWRFNRMQIARKGVFGTLKIVSRKNSRGHASVITTMR